jgi:hypothetical protein
MIFVLNKSGTGLSKRALAMEKHLLQLRAEQDRAVREFLSLEGWACAKAEVNAAVLEMINGSKSSTSSLAFLLRQISHLSPRTEPARRLNDLTRAIAALQSASDGQAFAARREEMDASRDS